MPLNLFISDIIRIFVIWERRQKKELEDWR